jgi:hypothetical protein
VPQTYTLATRPGQEGEEADFSVLVSTMDCSSAGRRRVCSQAVSLLWAGHEARVGVAGGQVRQETIHCTALHCTALYYAGSCLF